LVCLEDGRRPSSGKCASLPPSRLRHDFDRAAVLRRLLQANYILMTDRSGNRCLISPTTVRPSMIRMADSRGSPVGWYRIGRRLIVTAYGDDERRRQLNEGRSGVSLIRWRASLMSGFNSLPGHNYFPVRRRREFGCKSFVVIMLSMRDLHLGGQNR
jgi:hypothetical protein